MINIVSPHIDDSAFSTFLFIKCIGLKTTENISILNVFSVSGYNIDFKPRHILENTKVRITEDKNVYTSFPHVRSIYLPFIDDFNRNNNDSDLVQKITYRLSNLINDEDILVLPLSIGDHPDHVISLCSSLNIPNISINRTLFYEDLPYSIKRGEGSTSNKIQAIYNEFGIYLNRNIIAIGDIKEKLFNCLKYKSQIDNKTICCIKKQYQLSGGENFFFNDNFLDCLRNRTLLKAIS